MKEVIVNIERVTVNLLITRAAEMNGCDLMWDSPLESPFTDDAPTTFAWNTRRVGRCLNLEYFTGEVSVFRLLLESEKE